MTQETYFFGVVYRDPRMPAGFQTAQIIAFHHFAATMRPFFRRIAAAVSACGLGTAQARASMLECDSVAGFADDNGRARGKEEKPEADDSRGEGAKLQFSDV